MTLAEKLNRLLRPYKQTRVAKAAGLTTMTLYNLSTGITKSPSLATVNRLADALGVEAGWLIDRSAAWPPDRLRTAKRLRLDESTHAA